MAGVTSEDPIDLPLSKLVLNLDEQKFMKIEKQLINENPCEVTQNKQMEYIIMELDEKSDLEKYTFLMSIRCKNEKLFFYTATNYLEKIMSIIYTPTVGLACESYGKLFSEPQGMILSLKDSGKIADRMQNWINKNIEAICVTDGERVLGLGDLGVYGMGIVVGKLLLYTICAGVLPNKCLPVCLDVGVNTPRLLIEKQYNGIKHERLTGKGYIKFMDEFMESAVKVYGKHVLIHFEDFGNHNAFMLLKRYRKKYSMFNDDIEGTAAVTVAGILTSATITNINLREHKFLFQGAGEAAIGIATLLIQAMKSDGLTEAEAIGRIFMVDTKGLVVKNRKSGGLTPEKERFARDIREMFTLEEVILSVKPNVLIGVSSQPNSFTKKIVECMTAVNKNPVIFALSNPTKLSEISATDAYTFSKGRCLFASGSPFAAVTINKVTYHTGMCNNAFIFPGLALAVILFKIHPIVEEIFLEAAKVLASQVSEDEITKGLLYPMVNRITEVSNDIAVQIGEYAFAHNLAHIKKPSDLKAYVDMYLYDYLYRCDELPQS